MSINNNSHCAIRSKIISSYLLSWIKEGKINGEIGSSSTELLVASDAFNSTKKFHNEVNNPQATVKSIMCCLREMRINTKKFETLYGIPWPLLIY